MDQRIPIAVIGVGGHGQKHARSLKEVAGAELVGVYDLRAERGAQVAAELGVRAFASLDEALSGVRAVSIVIPTTDHAAVARQALARGVDVLVEKPITRTLTEADELMARFHSKKLSAGNSHKEDITLQIHDRITGAMPEVGFSIKSMLGAASTLLNPSAATSFIYKVSGLDESKIDEINAIDTRSKVRDRLAAILAAGGIFSFVGISSETFTKNLRRVDTVLPEIVAQLLLSFYSGKGSGLSDLITNLRDEETNILNFKLNHSDYEFKIKGLLHNVALGMVPDTTWDGLIRANGGYIIVREDGEVVCYHVYNADAFRAYLYKNTRFDTPSTTRYGFGKVYKEGGDLFIKLSLQIRFIK